MVWYYVKILKSEIRCFLVLFFTNDPKIFLLRYGVVVRTIR